jgi:hypothetical protein
VTFFRFREAGAGRARLARGGDPFLGGRLRLSSTGPTWRRLGEEVDLAGAAILSSSFALGGAAQQAELLLSLRDGERIRLRLHEPQAIELARILADAPVPAGGASAVAASTPRRRPPRGRGALAILVLGVLYLGCYGLMAATGYPATATVTAGDGEGFCDVNWEDGAGRQHRDEIGCDDEPVGTTVDVLVSGWPLPGWPATPAMIVFEALVVGLPMCGFAGGRLLYLRRRAPRWTGVGLAEPCAAEASATVWALTRESRRTTAAFVLGVLGLVAFLVAVTVVENRNEALRQSGGQAVGTVAELYADAVSTPGRAVVRYTASGGEWYQPVHLGANADNYTEGQKVTVFYDRNDPGRMTIDDEVNQASWTVLPMILALLGGLALTGLAAFRTIRGARIAGVLWSGAWVQVRLTVQPVGERITFAFADGSTWRSGRGRSWPGWDADPADPTDGTATDPEPVDAPTDELVWWVSTGARAVFSPSRGAPLVLARRLPGDARGARGSRRTVSLPRV